MSHPFPASIAFSDEQYQTLRQTYDRWWKGELGRPIVPIVTTGHPSHRQPSPFPLLNFGNAWDFSISPKAFVDAQDWALSTCRWHGEAFPLFPVTAFGPGTMAAFLGCTPVGRPDTVWFQPPEKDIPIEELHFEADDNNPNFRRVLNLYEAAMDKWRGSVVVGMADLGGALDVLAHFRGSENLLMDLYDAPEEVLRCVGELHELWFYYFDKINSILSPEARGYSHWFHLYCEQPSYILQCDFSYMISPEMFRSFVASELRAASERMPNAVYHMDGIGEIPHLEQLLAMDQIKGIQWVPGAGTPSQQNWDELLGKILASGKKLLSCCQLPDGSPIAIAKDPGQLYFDEHRFAPDRWEEAKRYGERFGIEVRV